MRISSGSAVPVSTSAACNTKNSIPAYICPEMKERNYIKIGIAGPVGSGKTALIERLTRQLATEYSLAVITNDIYTKEDAEFLTKNSLLPTCLLIGATTC